jgi:hypothetical protein
MYWPTEEVTAVESMLTSYGAQQRLGEVSRSSTCVIRRASTPEVRTRAMESRWQPLDT